MAQVQHLIAGDRKPDLEIVCRDADGLADFTNASAVVFYMVAIDGTTTIDGEAGSVSSGTGGRLKYAWDDDDTLVPGVYKAWFTVTTNSLDESWPNRRRDGDLAVIIGEGT